MGSVSIITWVLAGAIAGWLVSKAIKSGYWQIFDTIVGMAGALVSGFLFNVFVRSGDSGFNLMSICVAFVGAVILLILTRVVKHNPPVSPAVNNESR